MEFDTKGAFDASGEDPEITRRREMASGVVGAYMTGAFDSRTTDLIKQLGAPEIIPHSIRGDHPASFQQIDTTLYRPFRDDVFPRVRVDVLTTDGGQKDNHDQFGIVTSEAPVGHDPWLELYTKRTRDGYTDVEGMDFEKLVPTDHTQEVVEGLRGRIALDKTDPEQTFKDALTDLVAQPSSYVDHSRVRRR